MGVVSLDRGDQCGSNGGNLELWLWLWRCLGGSKVEADFFVNFFLFLVVRGFLAVGGERVAVDGWQWCHSIAEISAVILIPNRMWGCGCGGGWVAVKWGLIFL
jgi:hypothetical protein